MFKPRCYYSDIKLTFSPRRWFFQKNILTSIDTFTMISPFEYYSRISIVSEFQKRKTQLFFKGVQTALPMR